jgi:hypothetical protein
VNAEDKEAGAGGGDVLNERAHGATTKQRRQIGCLAPDGCGRSDLMDKAGTGEGPEGRCMSVRGEAQQTPRRAGGGGGARGVTRGTKKTTHSLIMPYHAPG